MKFRALIFSCFCASPTVLYEGQITPKNLVHFLKNPIVIWLSLKHGIRNDGMTEYGMTKYGMTEYGMTEYGMTEYGMTE